MKKFLKISGILLGVIIILLLLAPFLFKNSLENLLKKNINQNLNATVEWAELDLSLFSSFPDAAVVVKDFSVVNKAPFEGDTLARGERLKLDMGIMQLFKSGNEPIIVDALQLDNTLVNIKVDSLGQANYDIAVKKDAPATTETATDNQGFTFDLQHYEINDSKINYWDEATDTYFVLQNVNHEGTGDFSLSESELQTTTEALVTFRMGDVEYLSENIVSLDADFMMDLENQKYTFLENEARINELPLTFDGWVQVKEDATDMDLTFTTPSSDFKNFLAVIPKTYVKELDDVSTTGNFSVDGMLKGTVDETYIPKMNIAIKSDNASFKYPDLPKSVRNIALDVTLVNETGLIEDTYLNIGGITFAIDNEPFRASGSIKNIVENALVNLDLSGTLNLSHIEQVLPLELEQDMQGIFKANLTTNFDMASIEKEQYQNIKSNGTASLSNFQYDDGTFKNPVAINTANVSFSPGNIQLKQFSAKTGQTDVSATGTIQNLIPWIMAKQDLKGNFDIRSKTFNINDFMAAETTGEGGTNKNSASSSSSTEKEAIKIPDFLNASMSFQADKVLYDNITLTNVKGGAKVSEETATLTNVTSDIFGGSVALGGNVSTKNATPTFAMDLDLKKIDISESFQKMELLKYLAPIAEALQGDLNTRLKLNGELTNDLTPKLTTLAGDAVAQILTAEVDESKMPLLSRLGEKVSFLNIDRLSLRDVSTVLQFNNGNIEVQPFDFNVKGIAVTVDGSHGLDGAINYNATLDVPGRYLGSEVSNLLAKLDPANAQNVTVALPIGLQGTLKNPSVSVNTQAAVTELTQRLIEKQKQELKDKGTNILEDLITGGNKPKDSTAKDKPKDQTSQTTEIVKDIFGGLFGNKNKKEKDSVN
ncbi:AsmA-like C-terminal region-containing protein [Luteirhabdus pelagi]|uniref:AsmA-like C-terminal region-containing protein n=1 Tax=Luteirhabdus pelagi TaxID=2792783 RepID=UPI001939C310|nr:AsmA-like C-terminal region-containing protein [Luteirhabdus pelagi]